MYIPNIISIFIIYILQIYYIVIKYDFKDIIKGITKDNKIVNNKYIKIPIKIPIKSDNKCIKNLYNFCKFTINFYYNWRWIYRWL